MDAVFNIIARKYSQRIEINSSPLKKSLLENVILKKKMVHKIPGGEGVPLGKGWKFSWEPLPVLPPNLGKPRIMPSLTIAISSNLSTVNPKVFPNYGGIYT